MDTSNYGFVYDAETLDTEGIDPRGFDVFVRDVVGAGYFTEIDDAVSAYHDAVIGEISLTDYAWQYAEDCEGLTGFALDYFDAEKFGRDLILGGDIYEGDGWLFHTSW